MKYIAPNFTGLLMGNIQGLSNIIIFWPQFLAGYLGIINRKDYRIFYGSFTGVEVICALSYLFFGPAEVPSWNGIEEKKDGLLEDESIQQRNNNVCPCRIIRF